MSERRRFGADSTTSDVLAGIDLSGKVALVTGGSGGLGEETARTFAEKGVRVVLTARNVAKGEAAAQAIRASTGNDEVEVGDYAIDPGLAQQLWVASEEMVGERFDLL